MNIKLIKLNTLLPFAVFISGQVLAQAVDVEIDLNLRHEVGGISTFDRAKFITLHSSHTESDWDGGQQGYPNALPDLIDDFMNGRDVYFGRETGGISWHRRGNPDVDEDAGNPGWVDAGDMASEGLQSRNTYNADTAVHPYEARAATDILCAQYNGFWPNGVVYNGWAISTTDTPSEPFGSATGDFMGLYLDHFYDNFGAQSGRPSPPYVEIINEPDWHILDWAADPDFGSATADDIWHFHNGAADAIRVHNTNSLIGGFVTTFPDHDEDNFGEWNDEWKSFIDIAGTNMDFWSLHLYDFPSISGGQQRYRKGGNMEAMFDMIDYYSEDQLGVARPYIISEYGAQTHDYNNQGWSAYRDWLRLKSINSMVLSFMDRPHLMLKTIPFTVVKAEWGRGTYPYGPRLMRQANEPASYTGDWIYTDLVRFYDLWSDVNGTRVDVSTDDPDIQVDAYIDNDKVYVILNNIVSGTRTIDLTIMDDHTNSVTGVLEKSLYWNGSAVVLDETNHVGNISQTTVGSEGCVVLEYTMASPVIIDGLMTEEKYFAETYLNSITSGVASLYQIEDVVLATADEAELRIGFARAHGKSKQPTVLVNGAAVTVPTDLMGFESDDRFQFFGMLQIPVPAYLLQETNTVSVTFPDSDGHISTVALKVFYNANPDTGDIHIDYYNLLAGGIVLGFTNGPADSYFSLFSKSNLMDSVWTTNQTGLPTSVSGAGEVTNSTLLPSQFFRLIETDEPVVPPPPATVIEFVSPDYSNGTLNGQQDWNAEPNWSVADAAGVGYITTTSAGHAATIDDPIILNAGESYSLSINLQFTGSYSTPSGFVYTFMGGLKDSSAGASVATDSNAADANIQILSGVDNYRLLNNWSPIASQITAGALNDGDILQFDYTLTLGANAATTFYTVRLQNLTDVTDTGTGTVNGVDATIYNALTGSGAYGFFQSISFAANGSGLTGVQVNTVTTEIIP